MPELPDITVYVERLAKLLVGHPLVDVKLASPFLLRSVDPPLASVRGRKVTGTERVGKRVVLALEGDGDEPLFLVIHLMVAGRFQWKGPDAKVPGKIGLAAFLFPHGTLLLTEASQKKRASLHVVKGRAALAAHDPGGLDVMTLDADGFLAALHAERHTLKRTLTDPRTFSGIGNAYSDEILHRAKMSPVQMSTNLTKDDAARLLAATQDVLRDWTERLRAEDADKPLPEKVTAFRKEMAVHGKAGEPCPVCGSPVQRIAYADNETNYCATCQTGGKLLADRALSRLMKEDWPRTLDELEALKRAHRGA